MLAARLHDGESSLRVEAIEVPTPPPGECLVQVAACGVCGSDLHILDGETDADLPLTLGHEAAGIISAVGDGSEGFAPGDRVFIDPILVCGFCALCRSGRSHICPRRRIIGVNRDGAFAEFVCVPETNLVPLPPSLSLDHAAMIESASTVFHALTKRSPPLAGERVAVVGVGGLGFHAVAIAVLLGAAEVLAIDVNEIALERALGRGATSAFDGRGGDVTRAVRQATGGGVAVAVECVGTPQARATAFGCLQRGGCAVLVGVGNDQLVGPSADRFVAQEFEARGVFAYARDEIERVVRLASSGRLDLGAAISERFPLSEITEAVESFRDKARSPVRVLVNP